MTQRTAKATSTWRNRRKLAADRREWWEEKRIKELRRKKRALNRERDSYGDLPRFVACDLPQFKDRPKVIVLVAPYRFKKHPVPADFPRKTN